MGLQAPLPDRSGSPLIHFLETRRRPARAGIEVNAIIDRVASGATVFALEFALRPVMLGAWQPQQTRGSGLCAWSWSPLQLRLSQRMMMVMMLSTSRGTFSEYLKAETATSPALNILEGTARPECCRKWKDTNVRWLDARGRGLPSVDS